MKLWTIMKNISQLALTHVVVINEFLQRHNYRVFTQAYIDGLDTEFGHAMQDNEEYLFRGRFIRTSVFRHTIDGKAVQHALAINSCTGSYTTTEVLLLDENFFPIKIIHSRVI